MYRPVSALVRAAQRRLRTPGFVPVVTGLVAIAVAALLTLVTAASALLWRPLPFPDGERLVRLFGGEMVYNSRSDEERIFKVRRPSVVFPKPTAAETPDSNAMFYLLQNTVGSTPPLTAKELRDAAARASYGIETPTIQTLLAALDAQALHTELNSTLDAGQPARRAARM